MKVLLSSSQAKAEGAEPCMQALSRCLIDSFVAETNKICVICGSFCFCEI
jgi:hypothetical protein